VDLSEHDAFSYSSIDAGEQTVGRFRPTRTDIERAVRTLIAAAGDDPDREGLIETPARVARAYGEWFAGYAIDPSSILRRVFTEAEGYEETVLLRDIPLASTCEHHLARSPAKRTSRTGRAAASLEFRSCPAWSMPTLADCSCRSGSPIKSPTR
jgi:hypothetical protein